MKDLGISPKDKLNVALQRTSNLNFGGTDCSIPMAYATKNDWPIDAFIVLTDSETYASKQHPHQALEKYRRKMNKPQAKMIVVGMTSTGFSIANPDDPLMMDVVGFSTDTPSVMSAFIRGSI